MDERKMKLDHQAKYSRLVDALGREELTALLPKPSRPWREMLAEDEHLNNVPLANWDRRHGQEVRGMRPESVGLRFDPCPCCGTAGKKKVMSDGVWSLFAAARRSGAIPDVTGWSLSDTVCTLKELARQIAEAE